MNKDIYSKAMDGLHISENFYVTAAHKMRASRPENKTVKFTVRKMTVTFAAAALIVSAGAFALNYHNPSIGANPITVATVELPNSDGAVNARMMPLFVYQGRVYLQYNTVLQAADGSALTKEEALSLRGEYLGKTKASLDEWSKQEDYATEFASNIGESEVYTVKGYDSKYRLMVYMEYDGGFSCDIYDSYGGLTMDKGSDFFGLLKLKGNLASYQWESFDSWNNGIGERVTAKPDDTLNNFIKALYQSVPVTMSIDKLIDDPSPDSQKFLYLRTEDNMVTTLRLLKEGYVYVPEVGFFQIDKENFDAFYNSL